MQIQGQLQITAILARYQLLRFLAAKRYRGMNTKSLITLKHLFGMTEYDTKK